VCSWFKKCPCDESLPVAMVISERFLRASRLPLAFSSDPLIINTEKVTGETPAADSLINISPVPIGRSGGKLCCDGGWWGHPIITSRFLWFWTEGLNQAVDHHAWCREIYESRLIFKKGKKNMFNLLNYTTHNPTVWHRWLGSVDLSVTTEMFNVPAFVLKIWKTDQREKLDFRPFPKDYGRRSFFTLLQSRLWVFTASWTDKLCRFCLKKTCPSIPPAGSGVHGGRVSEGHISKWSFPLF